MKKGQFRVVDLNKDYYTKSDAYLNGHAKYCGWKATLVYDSLCRHSDRSGESFPSIQLMAKEHGVSEMTIRRGIKTLEDWNIIFKQQKRSKSGKWLHNTYFLLHREHWKLTGDLLRATDDVEANRRSVQLPPAISPVKNRRSPENDEGIPIRRNTHIRKRESTLSKKKYSSFKDIGEEEFGRLSQQYDVPPAFVRAKYEDMVDWAEANGRKKKNWYATLRNWVRNDAIKIRKEAGKNERTRAIDASGVQ